MPKRASGGYRDIAAYYEHLIRAGGLKPGEMLPTELSLASKHQVTRTTVRRAFEMLVNKGLILKAQGRGSRVAGAAEIDLRSRSSVVLVLPATEIRLAAGTGFPFSRHYHDALYGYVEGLVSALSRFGRPFRIAYFTAEPEDFRTIVASVREEGAAGMIVVDCWRIDVLDRVAESGLPGVFLDCHTHGRAVDSVKADNFAGAREATRHLLRTTLGPLAFFGGPRSRDEGSPHKDRFDGFLAAHREAGRRAETHLVAMGDVPALASSIADMLRQPVRPAGFVCSDDSIGVDVLERLRHFGVAVPSQASVVGFGNLLCGLGAVPALSTVLVDRRAMGLRAVELLDLRLADPSAPPADVHVPTVLALRQSTMPADEEADKA